MSLNFIHFESSVPGPCWARAASVSVARRGSQAGGGRVYSLPVVSDWIPVWRKKASLPHWLSSLRACEQGLSA